MASDTRDPTYKSTLEQRRPHAKALSFIYLACLFYFTALSALLLYFFNDA